MHYVMHMKTQQKFKISLEYQGSSIHRVFNRIQHWQVQKFSSWNKKNWLYNIYVHTVPNNFTEFGQCSIWQNFLWGYILIMSNCVLYERKRSLDPHFMTILQGISVTVLHRTKTSFYQIYWKDRVQK